MSGKGCCDTDCLAQRSENVLQKRTEPASTIKFESFEKNAELPRMAFAPIAAADVARIPPFADHRLKYSRAPELYMRNCALLI